MELLLRIGQLAQQGRLETQVDLERLYLRLQRAQLLARPDSLRRAYMQTNLFRSATKHCKKFFSSV